MRTLANMAFCAAAVVALVIAPAVANAQQEEVLGGKPVAVISLAGADEIMADVKYLTEVAGASQVDGMIDLLTMPYVQALQTDKPAGGVVVMVDDAPKWLAFLPVKDLDSLLEVLADQAGEAEDLGDGVFKLSDAGLDIFVTENDGWAFIAGAEDDVKGDLPADPATLLGDLPENYTLAVRGFIQNIPEPHREMALTQLRSGMEMGLEGEEDDPTFALQQKMAELQAKQWETYINDSDEITFGLGIDQAAKTTYIDIQMTASPGTKLARQLSAYSGSKTAFAGFLLPGAAVRVNVSAKMAQEEIDDAVAMVEIVRDMAMNEMENDEELADPAAREAAEDLLTKVFDVAIETFKDGTLDGAGALVLAPNAMTMLSGMHVADGQKVEDVLRGVAELAEGEPDFPGIEFDADSHDGVSLHKMTVPIPEDDAEARAALGEQLDVVVGTADDRVYLAFGKDCVAQLKSAMDQSKASANAEVKPMQVVVSLLPIMQFAAAVSDGDPAVAMVAEALSESQGKDHISITAESSGNGVLQRIEIEGGVIAAIGKAVAAAAGGLGGGPGPGGF